MLDIRGILTLFYDFYIVANAKSFNKAEEISNLSASNLSRSVKKLEENLKVKLINSNNKGFQLTLDGEKLFKQLDSLFNEFNSFIDSNISDNDINLVGSINIGTTRNIADNFLEKYITIFHKQYPNIKIKITIDSASNINKYLLDHKIDVLIDYMQQINFTEKYDLKTLALGRFQTCFASSKDFYNKNGNKIKSINDLKNYDIVIPGASRRRQMLDALLQSKNLELNPVCEMPDSKLMADFIKSNDCIGYFIKEEVESYDLKELNLDEELPKNEIGISYNKNTINNITKKFIESVLNNN